MQGRKTACELHARSQCPSTFVGLESALTGQDSGKITLTEQQLGPSWYDGKMMIYTLWKEIGEVEGQAGLPATRIMGNLDPKYVLCHKYTWKEIVERNSYKFDA